MTRKKTAAAVAVPVLAFAALVWWWTRHRTQAGFEPEPDAVAFPTKIATGCGDE